MSGLSEDLSPSVSGCLCLALRKATRVVTKAYDAAMAPHHLTIGQFSILAHTIARSDYSLVALAEAMALDQSSLSRAVRPLMRDGLIVLERDTSDARRRLLAITDKGRARFDQARVAWVAVQVQAHGQLGQDELPGLRRALHVLSRLPDDGVSSGR